MDRLQSNDPKFFYTKNTVVFKQINHFKHNYLTDYLFTLMSQFTTVKACVFVCIPLKRTYFNFIFPRERTELGFLYDFSVWTPENEQGWKKEVRNGWILVKQGTENKNFTFLKNRKWNYQLLLETQREQLYQNSHIQGCSNLQRAYPSALTARSPHITPLSD